MLMLALNTQALEEIKKEDVKKTMQRKLDYIRGLQVGERLRNTYDKPNLQAFLRGLEDAYGKSGKRILLAEPEVQAILLAWEKKKREIQYASQKKQAVKKAQNNLVQGQVFLEKERLKAGVVALPSGLLYSVLEEGKGKKPKDEDIVSVHFQLFRINGNELDNSYIKRVPLKVKVSETIAGWREALPKMKTGARWRLVIPPVLAYGSYGSAPSSFGMVPRADLLFDAERDSGKAGYVRIEKNETIIYEVELVSIN